MGSQIILLVTMMIVYLQSQSARGTVVERYMVAPKSVHSPHCGHCEPFARTSQIGELARRARPGFDELFES
jgi:hypothetical protein